MPLKERQRENLRKKVHEIHDKKTKLENPQQVLAVISW